MASTKAKTNAKQQPNEKILNALKLGQRIYGENKLQDAIKRWSNYLNTYNDLTLPILFHKFEIIIMAR